MQLVTGTRSSAASFQMKTFLCSLYVELRAPEEGSKMSALCHLIVVKVEEAAARSCRGAVNMTSNKDVMWFKPPVVTHFSLFY